MASLRAMRRVERLYHLAETENLASILELGLLSTEALLGRCEMPEAERAAWLRRHRPGNVRLPSGVLIRDQKPMPPSALAPALDEGMEPGDWYALLNGFVFLWPDPKRMDRQRRACGDRPQTVLTFDAAALVDRFAEQMFVSPINSGNARRKPARRGLGTFVPYRDWAQTGWPTGQRARPPAEFLFQCPVPAAAPFLIDVERRQI